MALVGSPGALPAVYLQTVFVYSMLATALLSHRLVLALAGFDSLDSMRQPLLLSTSIKEFWGKRWNLLIHNLMWRSFFKPFAARGVASRYVGAFLAFVMSGLFHEYMWLITNWHQMETYTKGLPLCFLLIQFVLTAIEGVLAKTQLGHMVAGLPSPVRTICTTLAVVPFGPLFLQGIYLMMIESTAVFPILRSQNASHNFEGIIVGLIAMGSIIVCCCSVSEFARRCQKKKGSENLEKVAPGDDFQKVIGG